jgi:transcriptional antiterminator NusG
MGSVPERSKNRTEKGCMALTEADHRLYGCRADSGDDNILISRGGGSRLVEYNPCGFSIKGENRKLALKWYIIHVYSGFENKVKSALEERIASFPQPEKFGEVVVPTEEIVELVKGKRKTSSRKFYPGYILVKMELNDATWHIVNNTADEEAQHILTRMEAGKLKPQPKYFFETGDEIRVVDGPFKNFNGVVDEVNPEKGKIRVLVSIFGRSTPVELEFVQVAKL